MLPIAPSTNHAGVAGRCDPAQLSARARRDGVLKKEIHRVFKDNFGAYVVCKVWRQIKREGFGVARCTVARLMEAQGLQGVIRCKSVRTTVGDNEAPCPLGNPPNLCSNKDDFITVSIAELGRSSS